MTSATVRPPATLPWPWPASPDGLPGLPPAGEPGPAAGEPEQGATRATDAPDAPIPDSGEEGLDRNQPAIWDAEPEPRQLPLLPDPDPWEADRPSPGPTRPRGGRLARRRSRTAVPPDQLSLF